MHIKSIDLAWIVVKDLKQAVKFYTEMGLKVVENHEEFGWVELQPLNGQMRLGLAQASKESNVKPGQNAIVTFTVDDIEKAKKELEKKGTKIIGKIHEIPHQVKMLFVSDLDGNNFQLVQVLGKCPCCE